MELRHKILMAVLVGIVASSAIYYGWCSLQWREAAEAGSARQDAATGAAAHTPVGGSASAIDPPTITSAVQVSPTVTLAHSFVDTLGTLTVDARLGNGFVDADRLTTLHLALTARSGQADGEAMRVPAHVVMVLDRSSSMAGARIEHARRAAEHVLDHLQDGDSIALVSYSSSSRVDLAATRISAQSREQVRSVIRSIDVGGGTCISCGLETASGVLMGRQHDGVQRVILLSDGQANSGLVDSPSLRNLARGFDERGAPVTTIGVGLDYNEDLMTQIAVGGNGRHFFVEDPTVLATVLRDELDTLDKVVARRVVARFRLAPGVRLARGFDRDFQVDGDIVSVSLGDMPANAERTALVALSVTPDAGATSMPITGVEVDFEDLPSGGATRHITGQLTAHLTRDPATLRDHVEPEVAARVEQAALNEALLEANEHIRKGDIHKAQQVIDTQWQQSRAANASLGSAKLDTQLRAFEEIKDDIASPAAAAEPMRKSRAKKNAELNRTLME